MLGEVLALHKAVLSAAALCVFGAAVWTGIYRKERRKSRAVWWMALLLFVCLGWVRMKSEEAWAESVFEAELDEKELWIEGTVKSAEKGKGEENRKVSLILTGCRIYEEQTEDRKEEEAVQEGRSVYPVRLGRVDIFYKDGLEHVPKAGRKIRVYGKMKERKAGSNPGEFDYRLYYLGLHSCYTMYGEKEKVLTGRQTELLSPFLSGIREKGEKILDSILDEEDSGIMKAMIFGDKADMDENIRSLYQRNGIAHILAISGLHISLLGGGIYRLFRKSGAGFPASAGAGVCFLFLYGLMTGFSPSSLRAVLMMAVFFLSECLGRTYDVPSAAGLAGILLLLHSPFLIFQSGFQLSFGAVLSVSLLGDWMKEILKPKTKIGEQMAAGAAIQIGTCPIILYHFYQYPVYSFFLNLAVIPLVSWTVLSAMGGMAAGILNLPLGRAAAGTCHYVLLFYEFLCVQSEKLPGSTAVMGRPSLWQILFYVAAAAAGLSFLKKMPDKKECSTRKTAALVLLCLCLSFLFHPGFRRLNENRLTVTFLDVGQGDGILVEKRGLTILIDGGSTDKSNVGRQILEPCLKSKGISRIDYLIISHADEDHINGARYLMEECKDISVENLILSVLGREEESQKELIKAFGKKEYVKEMKAGDSIQAGELRITCLYPEKEDEWSSRNQQSLVCQMSFYDFHILFTGDTEAECERRMTERPRVKEMLAKTDILKVAHHGSSSSTSKEFLEALGTGLEYGVISCGAGNNPTTKLIQA